MPVFALRGKSDLGIGDLGAMKEAVTWAARNRIGVVQVLPINETGNDHSPYNLLSGLALDPLMIETVPGALPGLDPETFSAIREAHAGKGPPDRVDYPSVKRLKTALLQAGFDGLDFAAPEGNEFVEFEEEEAAWLTGYSTFRALVDINNGNENFFQWPETQRSPESAGGWLAGLDAAGRTSFERVARFRRFVQWVAHRQWRSLRDHAERQGVALIGDVPVGVSLYSADVWSSPELFDLTRWSGAPPEKVFQSDPFTMRWGQNWGFPLYHWENMSRDNFQWWRRRLRSIRSIFHLLRVDHALGFFRIYSFPWRPEENARFTTLSQEEAAAITGGPLPCFVDRDDETEENRVHNRMHGEMVLRMFLEETGPHRLIAEDLGEVAPYVRPMLAELDIPGFKIPQWERVGDRMIPGSDYPRLSLATFGTHDHPPIITFWNELAENAASPDPAVSAAAIQSQREFLEFCGQSRPRVPVDFTSEVHRAFVSGLLETNSWLAVHMICDLFGSEERFNVPGSAGAQNWSCRLLDPVSTWDRTHRDLLAWFRKIVSKTDRKPGNRDDE